MSSPFGNFHNAIITVPQLGSDVELDQATGNWVVAPSITIPVKAVLKQGGTRSLPQPGIDTGLISLSGYLVDPMFLPATQNLPVRLPCTIKTANAYQVGEIELYPVIGSAFGVDEIIGQKIQGLFKVEDGN